MSSILKALRKLEEEKAALGEGGVDLARDILKRSAPQRNNGGPLILKVAFFGVLALGLIIGLWLMLGSTEPVTTTVAPTPVETLQKKPIMVPTPQAEVKSLSEVVQLSAKTKIVKAVNPGVIPTSEPKLVEVEMLPALVPPAPEQRNVEVEKTSVVAPPIPEPALVVSEPVKLEPAVAVKVPVVEQAPAVIPQAAIKPPVPPVSEQVLPADLPELRVTTIAFKSLPGERLAVVNDLPVMEGTSIDGVKIVEILEEGVRFSWQGMEFVLPVTEEPPQN